MPSPHLTLARNRDGRPAARLLQAVDELATTDFGVFTAGAFGLYQSEPQAGGSVYTMLSEYKFSEHKFSEHKFSQ